MTVSAKTRLLAELSKLTPNPEEKAKLILEEFEQLHEELKLLRSMLTLSPVQHDLPGEVWKDIEGYEELYQVSNKGRIKSLHHGKERIMKLTFDRGGYVHIVLYKNKEKCTEEDKVRSTYRVHILVARAFIPNPENKPEVNHINGNKWDCSVENLEWVTKKRKSRTRRKIGTSKIWHRQPQFKTY